MTSCFPAFLDFQVRQNFVSFFTIPTVTLDYYLLCNFELSRSSFRRWMSAWTSMFDNPGQLKWFLLYFFLLSATPPAPCAWLVSVFKELGVIAFCSFWALWSLCPHTLLICLRSGSSFMLWPLFKSHLSIRLLAASSQVTSVTIHYI